MKSDSEILEEIKELIDNDLKSVSYKWLSRRYIVPANYAKQLLFSFTESRRGSVNVTYTLAGWTKDPTPQHQISIVGESQLKEAKKKLDPITSLHVYSVQPSQPREAAELWNSLSEQTSALFDKMVIAKEQNCMWGCTLGAVACPEAVRDPELAQKVQPPPEPEAAEKPPGKFAAKIKAAVAGKAGDKAAQGASSASVAVTGPKAKDSLAKGPKSAPAASQKGGGKGKSMAGMWSKAPPKKAAAPVVDSKMDDSEEDASSEEEVPEQAARQSSHQEQDSEDEEAPAPTKRPASAKPSAKKAVDLAAEDSESEDDLLPRKKTKAAGKALDSDSEDGQPAARKKPAGAKGKVGKGKAAGTKARAGVVVDSEDEDSGAEWEKKAQPAAKKRGRPKKDSPTPDDDEEDAPKGGKKGPAKPAYGSVKAGAAASKRRKVTQTVINDKGEEVTEDVWEEDPADPGTAGDAPEERPSQKASQGAAPKAAEPKAAAKSPGGKAPAKKGPAAASAKSPGKVAPKKGGAKGKPAGQKGIMSFFGKK